MMDLPFATNSAMLTPALALIVWTLLIWILMYSRRIPAMQKAGIDPQDAQKPGSLDKLPDSARFAADNYNHLHEQPTVFYALVFYTFLAGNGGDVAMTLAWIYVALRVVHSVIQVTANKVMARFAVFALSSLVLIGLTGLNLANL